MKKFIGKNISGYSLYYDFKYKTIEECYRYELPLEMFILGIRDFFSDRMVELDGKDTDIWNLFADFDNNILYEIFKAKETWFEEMCKEDAYQDFVDMCEEYYEEELYPERFIYKEDE